MRVVEVIDPAFRSGEKNGKPWVLSKVRTDDGKEATGFSLNVGDEVKLSFNEKYNNYSAEKLTPQKQEKAQLEDTLNTILSSLGRIEQHLGINTTHREMLPQNDPRNDPEAPDLPPVEAYDEGPY